MTKVIGYSYNDHNEKTRLQLETRSRANEIFLFCLCIFCIGIFCWLGLYARPQADDYFELSFGKDGFLAFQVQFYQSWAGRLMRTLLVTIVHIMPLKVSCQVMPIVEILFYVLTMAFLVKTLVPESLCRVKWLNALFLTSSTLTTFPALNESLYWIPGIQYFVSPIFLMLLLALAVRALRGSTIAFVLGLAVCFANGTLSEQACVFQGIVAFIATLYFWRYRDKRCTGICAAFWLVSIMAFLVMYLAPGTAVRIGDYAHEPLFSRLAQTLAVAVAFGGVTVVKFFVKPLVWLLLLFLPSIRETLTSDRKIRLPQMKAWHIFALTIAIAPLMHGITGWAGGEGLPLRAESLAIWMMGFTWVLLWVFCYSERCLSQWGESFKKTRLTFCRRPTLRWILLIAALLLNFNCLTAIKDLATGTAARYAAECDAREAQAEAARERGEREVVVKLLTEHPALLFYSDMRPWNAYWVNVDFAKFHGLDSAIALPSVMCDDLEAIARWKGGQTIDYEQIANGSSATDGEIDADLAFVLGEFYDPAFADTGVAAKDSKRAAHWYEKAAEAGNVQACRRLTRLSVHNEKIICAGYWFLRSVLPMIRI